MSTCTVGAARTRTGAEVSGVAPERLAKAAVGILLATAMVVLLAGVIARPAVPAASVWTDVSLGQNGTLWELAQAHPVPGLSVSETVDLIQAANNLSSSTVHVGQSLRVPLQGDHAFTVAAR